MTTFLRESARIYDFPLRGRFAAAAGHDDNESAVHFVSPRIKTVTGGAWYHEEAVQDADLTRKN